jgi:homoserine O-acetyltransferase/O-succinyltransferase
MSEEFFASSDSARSGAPLEHAQSFALDDPFQLEMGGVLPEVTVAYETYGRLNGARDNAVLICHALSGDSHVARHDEDDAPGWWDIVVGSGKPVDTDRYFVICPNVLGGCRGTTGPNSTDPRTGKAYGADFPTITVRDMVELQRRLVDHLGIDVLLAVVGGSMGGHQVLHWATAYPSRVRGAVPIATSVRLSSQALAFDIVGRNAILHDPNFRRGQYYGAQTPDVGLAIARMIGHITYLSREAMQRKFEADRLAPRDVPISFEKEFSVGSYLGYKGAEFVERFDANSYVTLSMAMDLFDLGATRQELVEALGPSTCEWLVVSFSSDWLFSPAESQTLVDVLIGTNKSVSYCNVRSSCGHDAFLLPDDLDRHGELIRAFLSDLSGVESPIPQGAGEHGRNPTSMFHPENPHRLDYELIAELVGDALSVLDLGCGNGELLMRLSDRATRRTMGLELDELSILQCVRRGLNVIHADLNDGLLPFADKQFDCVVLSRTLQAVRDVEAVVSDMVRVGRRCIVSFPNFGYYKLREMLGTQGRAPEAPGLLRYKWYNTPNIRFFTIDDFEGFCAERSIRIHRRVCLDTEEGREVYDAPNLRADLAMFVLSR